MSSLKDLNYRLFPVLLLGFFRVANAVAIGLVIPLYFYEEGYSPDLIGVLSSSMTFSYIFSPLLLNRIARNMKKKYALLISASAIMIIQITFQFTLEPWFFLIMRLLEGMFLGFFWPVLGGTISSLNSYREVKNDSKLENRIMKSYTLSWNFGSIFGFLVGAFFLFIISNLEIIFDICLIYSFIIFITVIIYEEPINQESSISTEKKKSKSSYIKENKLKVSIYFSFTILILYAFIGNSFKFLYPIKSEILNFETYTNYLLSFILSVSQLIFTNIGMGLSVKSLKKSIIISLSIEFFIFIFSGINDNLLLFSIFFGMMGLSLSFLYCYAFKTTVSRNVEENTSKYSYYFESIIGFGFFLGPIIAGLIANLGINTTFFVFSGFILLLISATIIYIILQRNKNNNKV